ncbi:MAG: ABC transporter ATP-binding protein [Candidatus Heimdallarchaeota archaeon]|nr:ABC transporter ATP-binding protein [Candidatus Heimdallarchaeota archaeon]
MTITDKNIAIEVRNLKKYFPVQEGFLASLFKRSENKYVHAVDDVSFAIKKGETFGLVGESGCGKSTTGYLIVQIEKLTSGSIYVKGVDAVTLSKSELNEVRKELQIIFQNPYESMSPRFSILDIIAEPLRLLNIIEDEDEIQKKVLEELTDVGLIPAEDFLDRFPHELSGGQRQRVSIARAFALDPTFVVADEPVSMLDVSIRVGVLKTMQELSKKRGTAFLFITHDLALARSMCDRIAVMYLGRIVEQGPTEEIVHNPLHPYTKALIAAVPVPDPDARRTEELPIVGEVPSGIDIAEGCRFHPRCIYVVDECKKIDPQLEPVKDNYSVACIRYKEINKIK